jgi:hypothetical protein
MDEDGNSKEVSNEEDIATVKLLGSVEEDIATVELLGSVEIESQSSCAIENTIISSTCNITEDNIAKNNIVEKVSEPCSIVRKDLEPCSSVKKDLVTCSNQQVLVPISNSTKVTEPLGNKQLVYEIKPKTAIVNQNYIASLTTNKRPLSEIEVQLHKEDLQRVLGTIRNIGTVEELTAWVTQRKPTGSAKEITRATMVVSDDESDDSSEVLTPTALITALAAGALTQMKGITRKVSIDETEDVPPLILHSEDEDENV